MCKHRAAAVSRHLWKSLVAHMLGLSLLQNMQSLLHLLQEQGEAYLWRPMSNLCWQPAPMPLLSQGGTWSHPLPLEAQHPIIIAESNISSAHTEALRKVPFSYLCIYYMNSHGTGEVSIFICRPDINSRSDKLSELWHLEQKTEVDSVWDQTNIHKWGCRLM